MDIEKLKKLSKTGTANSFIELSDEDKKVFFAMAILDSMAARRRAGDSEGES